MGERRQRVISVAILAMGGEGGGVLADWLIDMAEREGYAAQNTSAPGVAQRTGSTIYYIEMFPEAGLGGREPVFALMPVAGDVDVVVASELMEGARAVQRGIVTPDRTTLIASTNRVYAISEKVALDDGRVGADELLAVCRKAARRLVAADMAGIAEATGSVISAALFGALAGSGALPFPRDAFEAAIRRGGIGVEASLRAFAQGFAAADGEGGAAAPPVAEKAAPSPAAGRLDVLLARVQAEFPEAAVPIVTEGVRRLVDYQDFDYAGEYLDRLAAFRNLDPAGGRLLAETARYLALGMSYEDTIRVAELKIRAARFARVRDEVKAGEAQIVRIHDYFHPRVEEIADTLPTTLGRWLLNTPWATRLVRWLGGSGKIISPTSLHGFLMLAAVASRKPARRRTLRHAEEERRIAAWLAALHQAAAVDYDLACEVAECRNLVKGYGDTHAYSRRNFEVLMALLPTIAAGPAPAERLATLRKAALTDDTGAALAAALGAGGAEAPQRRA